jgi:hypothetical protein
LCVSDLLVKVISALVNRNSESFQEEGVVDLLSKLSSLDTHGDQLNLSGRNPEIPFASSVLAENGDKSFQRAEYSSVNDDWSSEAVLEVPNFRIS